MNEVTCLVCGSGLLERHVEQETLKMPYAPLAEYPVEFQTCLVCGETTSVGTLNDERREAAMASALRLSVSGMLDWLSEQGYSMASMERLLGLSPRTMARWKNGEISAAATAMLRFIRTYPWLLEVADGGFDPSLAKEQLLAAAAPHATVQEAYAAEPLKVLRSPAAMQPFSTGEKSRARQPDSNNHAVAVAGVETCFESETLPHEVQWHVGEGEATAQAA